MTNEEAARERDRARQEANERANIERNQSSKEREQAVKERNAERRQERVEATNALTSGSAIIKLAEITRLGGPVGKKLEREIRQFQQTGRVSSWLAGETLKAEAAQNAAQQSAFRQAVTDIISIPQQPIQIGQTNSYIPPLSLKPIIEPEGGGGESCIGLALYTKTVETTTEVWIGAGTVAGKVPSGFDPEEGKIIASGGSGNVWAEVNINETTGAVVSVAVNSGSSTPNNTNTSFYYPLGYYEYSGDPPSAIVADYGCGSVDVAVCRNWFVSQPPFYGVSFQRGN